MSTMPGYVPPLGTPLYWGDEQSGTLAAAVMRYFDGVELEPSQFALLKSYLVYVVDAPCWDNNEHHTLESRRELERLRVQAKQMQTQRDIIPWIYECVKWGIDPL